ncbi:MAG: hypothetical protein H7Z37_09910 [Pyrinomonadaceae bacterium]|nr:hypothetical protein [Pyrinomonadaceae bacterium]
MFINVDKIGSAVSPLNLTKRVAIIENCDSPKAGDVVVTKAISESVTYGNLELPNGRLAKINNGDVLLGVLGRRRALKGFVGDVPDSIKVGDDLNLLNMGGVIGVCKGQYSALSDAIKVKVIGIACDENQRVLNIADNSLKRCESLTKTAPLVIVAGTCMNSGKTFAATEIIKRATHNKLRVAGAKLSGVACLRDTLNMQDHGAIATASFLDCGLPSTVGVDDLAPMAKTVINHLNTFEPDLIVIELGDGILGGYSVDSILQDAEIRKATAAFVFCASDYVGAFGGIELLKRQNITVDVISGSVTDSQMGEDFIKQNFAVNAGNARRDGARLFELVTVAQKKWLAFV